MHASWGAGAPSIQQSKAFSSLSVAWEGRAPFLAPERLNSASAEPKPYLGVFIECKFLQARRSMKCMARCATKVHVEVVQHPLSLERYTGFVQDDGAGAIATFTGVTRDNFNGKRVVRLDYEAYAPMAEKKLQARTLLALALQSRPLNCWEASP